MNRSRITVFASLVAAIAIAAGVVVFTTRDGNDTSSRDRNAALDNKLDTTFGNGGYMLINHGNRPYSAVDSVTTNDGTTYVVGTLIIDGLRHATVRSTKDGLKGQDVFILPMNDYRLHRGAWSQPLKETVPIALSVDDVGSVWILADGYHSNNNGKTPFVTHLKKSDLSFYSGCGICGIAFSSRGTITDIAVNPAGDRLVVTSPEGSYGFKPTSGKEITMGFGFSLADSNINCTQKYAATHVIATADRFYAVNSLTTPKTAMRLTFGEFPKVVECTDKIPLETISAITVDGDGSLYAYGRSTEKTVGFIRMQAGAMSSGTGMGYFSPRMMDAPTLALFPGGITASSGTLHMAASVNSLNGPKTIIEYVVRNNSFNISTAVDDASSDITATLPPLLTRHGSTLTLVSPTSFSGTSSSLVARFNASEPLVGAPEWPVSTQTFNLEYGRIGRITLMKPGQTSTLTLDGGELPPGMTLHPTIGLRGTPQSVGTFTARIKATNSGGSATSAVTFKVAAVAPTEGVITGWKQIDGNVMIAYSPGQFGSEKDVITAGATDPSGTTIIGECEGGECIFPEGNLDEGVIHDVRITHRNDVGEALSINSLSVTPLGRAQKVSDVSVNPGFREATVSFTEPANTEELTVSRFEVSIVDKETNIVVSAIGCDSSPCNIDIDAPDSQRKYTASVAAIYNDAYSLSATKSPEFSVRTPKSVLKFEFNSDMTYKVAARQFFVIPLMAQGSDGANISASSEFYGVEFKSNPARLEGSLYPGTYEIPVTADTDKGTITSAVRIEVAPGKLPEPEVSIGFNTFDGKLSMRMVPNSGTVLAATKLNWKAQVDNKILTGQCAPTSLCALNGIPFDSEVTFSIQAASNLEESSDWVHMTVFTPSPEKPVSIDTASFELIESTSEVGIVQFAIRTSLARKFIVDLQADATIQVDAETTCSLNFITGINTYRGEVVEGCPVDPYIRLFNSDAMLAEDDDSGAFNLYDPAALEEDEDARPYGSSNILSPRLSKAVTPGSYTIEVADYSDVMSVNADRRFNSGEVDIYLIIITTPGEAERLVKTAIVAESTPVTPQVPIALDVTPADVVMVPQNFTPVAIANETLEGPQVNAAANKSGANVTNLAVTAGNKSLTLTPNVMTSKPEVPQVKVTLTPGNKTCTTTAGSACTITGLSPWLTYSASAIIPGDASGASMSGLRTALVLKARSKVNVASLGLTTAAKSLQATVAKQSLRASGNCSLNAAQTVLTVGASGSCTVSVRTTKTVKKKALVGPSLSLRAAIK